MERYLEKDGPVRPVFSKAYDRLVRIEKKMDKAGGTALLNNLEALATADLVSASPHTNRSSDDRTRRKLRKLQK